MTFSQVFDYFFPQMAPNNDTGELDVVIPSPHYDDPTLKDIGDPFPPLSGEIILFIGNLENGIIVLSNYRLFLKYTSSFINTALGNIETIEIKEIFYLMVLCKDAHTVRCIFKNNESCQDWYTRISNAVQRCSSYSDVFALKFFHAFSQKPTQDTVADIPFETHSVESNGASSSTSLTETISDCFSELENDKDCIPSINNDWMRMGFDFKNGPWRITNINDHYQTCISYPKEHIVPAIVQDDEIAESSRFRSSGRFPSVTWRDSVTGIAMARCSQPLVGWFGHRSQQDEKVLDEIFRASLGQVLRTDGKASPTEEEFKPDKKMFIADARSYTAALANRAKGGGCETGGEGYYTNCEITFLGLPNIHYVRGSFKQLRTLCFTTTTDQSLWLSGLESTKWLHCLSALLESAIKIAKTISVEQRPVLIHCSDGWDRTPQLCALTQIILDKHYRTIQGFQVLIEREWVSFGHKFPDRCGIGLCTDDLNERCPVFLQFLDCIHQLMKQFPCAFEFSEAFLVKLHQHIYSCLFGTFLCNRASTRDREELNKKTKSVWSLLNRKNLKFRNYSYDPETFKVLQPAFRVRELQFWSAVYLPDKSMVSSSEGELNNVATTGQVDHSRGAVSVIGNESANAPAPEKLLANNVLSRSCDRLDYHTSPPEVTTTEDVASPLRRQNSDPQLSIDSPAFKGKGELSVCESANPILPAKSTSNSSSILSSDNDCNCEEVDTTQSSSEPVLELNAKAPPTNICQQENNFGLHNLNLQNDTINTLQNGESCVSKQCHEDHIVPIVQNNISTEAADISSENDHSTSSINGCSSEQESDETPAQTDSEELKNRAAILCAASTETLTADMDISNAVSKCANNESSNNLKLTRYTDASTSTSDLPAHWINMPVSHKQHANNASNSNMIEEDLKTESASVLFNFTSPSFKSIPNWFNDNGQPRLDIDGLVTWIPDEQRRIAQQQAIYLKEIAKIKRKCNKMLEEAYQNCYPIRSIEDDMSSTVSDSGSSIDHTSNSDNSWEPLDEAEAPLAMWMPDHAVTHCADCSTSFWMINRKHHCRNCGSIFCHECTKQCIPVPRQMYSEPVRVCRQCYSTLSEAQVEASKNTQAIIEIDGFETLSA